MLAILVMAQPALAQSAPAPSTPHFNISKQTTRITQPLRPDGTVDYLAAINLQYSVDVTPENNGFVLCLQVVDAASDFSPKVKEEFFLRCGAVPHAPDASVWESFADYLTRIKHPNGDARASATDTLTAARLTPWLPADHEDLAAFMKLHDKELATLSQAASRPKWWIPLVSADGRTMADTKLPSLGPLREVAIVFCARANMRARSGDFEGFWSDIAATKLLAQKMASGSTLIERMVGVACDAMASNSIACVGASGLLSVAQARLIVSRLDRLRALPPVTQAIDHCERYSALDDIQQIASGHVNLLQSPIDWLQEKSPTLGQIFERINPQAVDWDVVLKGINDVYDEMLRIDGQTRVSELTINGVALEKQFEDWNAAVKDADGTYNLAQRANETKADYSRRVWQSYLIPTTLMPSGMWKSEVLLRRAVKLDAMTRVVLAAAQVKADTGQWPATQEELVPRLLSELPKDMYSPNGADPFKYSVRRDGIRVYSVGENGKDDGGINDSATSKDDLGVGVP